MTKIMFLDFDGVISTSRAWVAQKHIEDFHTRWIDPIAVGLVTEACRVRLHDRSYQHLA